MKNENQMDSQLNNTNPANQTSNNSDNQDIDELIKQKEKQLKLLELEEKINGMKQKDNGKDFITAEEVAYREYKLKRMIARIVVILLPTLILIAMIITAIDSSSTSDLLESNAKIRQSLDSLNEQVHNSK